MTQLLQGLVAKYGLDIRFVDLGEVNSLEDVHRGMGFQPRETGYTHTDADSPNVNFVINGLDRFVLGNVGRFIPFRDLDAAMQPLTIAAQNAGVMLITHPENIETYERDIKSRIYKVVQQSHWLSEFLWRRFHGIGVE